MTLKGVSYLIFMKNIKWNIISHLPGILIALVSFAQVMKLRFWVKFHCGARSKENSLFKISTISKNSVTMALDTTFLVQRNSNLNSLQGGLWIIQGNVHFQCFEQPKHHNQIQRSMTSFMEWLRWMGMNDSTWVHVSVSAGLSVPEQHLCAREKPVQPLPSDIIEIHIEHGEGL